MRAWITLSLLALFLTIAIASSQSSDNPTVINLMIDAQYPSTAKTVLEADTLLDNIYNQLQDRNLVATIYATQDVLKTDVNLDLTRIALNSRFELAMSGKNPDEIIGTRSYAEQRDLLETSKRWTEACRICGQNNITVYGFIPQSFDQNDDTYAVLDYLGVQYDAGFQAGLIYTPGHENDVWPYLIQGHNVYAVPVSIYALTNKTVVLQDKYFVDNGLGADQWQDALVGKLDDIQGTDEPLVISLTTSVSGSGDYLNALSSFLDYAISRNASFVTTMQLVILAKTGAHDASLLTANVSSECPTCGENKVISINFTETPAK